MKLLKLGLIIFASTGVLFLGACSNSNQGTESSSNSPTPTLEAAAKTETVAKSDGKDHSRSTKGGQVVESGKYHLEFVPEKEANKTHLDFYVLKGDNHEAVSNAKVTADIQLPDGKLKTIPLSYDAEGKHYAAVLSEKLAGQYQVKMTADIGGEKVNGRFNFNQ
jgi:hypothetical protein